MTVADPVAAAAVPVHRTPTTPGRVRGVRLGETTVAMHAVLARGAPLRAAAADIRRRVAAVSGGTVEVKVADIADAEPC